MITTSRSPQPARAEGDGEDRSDSPEDRPFSVLMVAASPFPLPQGSQVLISGLAESLHRRGHTIQIVAYPTGKDRPETSVPIRRAPNMPFYQRLNPGPSVGKPAMDLLLAGKVMETVRRQRPDLLHTHNFEGLLVGLWVRWRTGVPVIYHLHNLMEPELPVYFRFPPMQATGRLFGRWIDHHLPRRADACIVLHDKVAGGLQERGIAPKRLHVVPPGVDLPDKPLPPPSEVRRRWGLSAAPLVLYSGNFDRYQDLDFLLQAFEQVQRAHPATRLLLVTHQGIERKRERDLQRRLGNRGQLLAVDDWEDMVELLSTCSVAVSPRQICWGFPIKVLNYMVAGRPIVAAAGSAHGLHHMETAWIVPNRDTAAFAQAILALLANRRLARRLGQAARREVEQHYTWPACAQRVEAVYREVLN